MGVAGVDALLGEPRWQPYPDRHATGRARLLSRLVGADRERDQVGRDLGRLHEACPLAAIGTRRGALDGHVADRRQPGGVDELEGEAGLEFGLVEAWEGAPRVGRLELRRGVALARPGRAVEASQGLADLAPPLELEGSLAREDVSVELQRRRL